MSNLRFDINQLQQAIDTLLITYPELAEDAALRADMFEAETDLHQVIATLLDKAAEAKSMASAIKARMDDLLARKARYDRQEEAFRSLIQGLMERADLQKLTLPEATLSLSWRKPAPVITNEDALPDALCRFIRKPDMAAVKTAVEVGDMPPGVSMSNGRMILRVLTK